MGSIANIGVDNVDMLTLDERISYYSDEILKNVLGGDEASLGNRRALFGMFRPNVFRDEAHIIYSVLYHFKDKGFTPYRTFIKMYLGRNTGIFRKNSSINLADFGDDFDSYIAAVLSKYDSLVGDFSGCTLAEFELIVEKYKQDYCALVMGDALTEARVVLYDGVQVGSRFYQGYEDSVALYKQRVAAVDGLFSKSTGDGFVDSRTAGVQDDTEGKKLIKVSDFDLVDELNEHLGGFYTSLFYSVLAPTKSGKSKFCARAVHTAMVKYGTNVSVWPHEGGYKAWWAQMRAIHFEYLYIRNKPIGERVYPLSQREILFGDYPSDAVRILEEQSRYDLFTNPNYGVMNMIDRPFKLETFIEEMETSVKLNDSKMVVIDYLQLITSDSNKSKPQVIGDAYQLTLSFCNKMGVCVISPAQFTQEAMKEASVSKDNKVSEARVVGGESSQVVRTPDINIAIYATVDDLANQRGMFMSIPSRLQKPFAPVHIYMDLRSCVFSSLAQNG